MTPQEMHDAAWVIQLYFDRGGDVIDSEQLRDWLEEYQFYRTEN